MKTIYILLTKPNTILAKIIHFAVSDTYTHASISFDKDFHTVYSSAGKNGKTIFPAGPCRENLQNKKYGGARFPVPCAVYELPVSDETYEAAKCEVERIMEESNRYHYNIIGLLLCWLNIPYQRKYHFFCSQFVGEILSRSHAAELPKETSLMRPSDYMDVPGLFCRFHGYLNEVIGRRQLEVA